jgi:hypothetical protein
LQQSIDDREVAFTSSPWHCEVVFGDTRISQQPIDDR